MKLIKKSRSIEQDFLFWRFWVVDYTNSTTFKAFLEAISTRLLAVAIIDKSESILLMQEPQPIADAPAANAKGAVVGLIAVAVIIGKSMFLESSIVLEIVNSALSIKPLAPSEM